MSRRCPVPLRAAQVLLTLTAMAVLEVGSSIDPGIAAEPPKPVAAAAASGASHPPRMTPTDFDARTFDDGAGHTLPYRIFIPRGLAAGQKVPLVLFFHGSGGRGT